MLCRQAVPVRESGLNGKGAFRVLEAGALALAQRYEEAFILCQETEQAFDFLLQSLGEGPPTSKASLVTAFYGLWAATAIALVLTSILTAQGQRLDADFERVRTVLRATRRREHEAAFWVSIDQMKEGMPQAKGEAAERRATGANSR